MCSLLNNSTESGPLDPIPTPSGNGVLLHGFSQMIHMLRDLSPPVEANATAIPIEEVETLETLESAMDATETSPLLTLQNLGMPYVHGPAADSNIRSLL